MDKLTINGYVLEDASKVTRAIEGVVKKDGELAGGVGDDAPDEVKLAAYDRLHGYITYKGEKVKNGSFCDIKESKKKRNVVVIEEPKPMLQYKVRGETVYVPIDKPMPMKVKVQKLADEQIKAKERK